MTNTGHEIRDQNLGEQKMRKKNFKFKINLFCDQIFFYVINRENRLIIMFLRDQKNKKTLSL